MSRIEDERVLMRIFIGESDRHEKRALHEVLLELFRREGVAGATVLRGIAGFGPAAEMHTDHLLSLSHDLPLVVEVVDTEAKIEEILPRLDDMLQGGMVTLEKARVIRYQK